MERSEDYTKSMTTAGLNLIAQALSIYDSDLRLVLCNAPFQPMFDLPDASGQRPARLSGDHPHLANRRIRSRRRLEGLVRERVEQARAFEPHYMERTRANGRTISVEGSPLPQGGWVTVYTDITRAKRRKRCCAPAPRHCPSSFGPCRGS